MTTSQDLFGPTPAPLPGPPRRSHLVPLTYAPAAAGRRRLDVPLLFVLGYMAFQIGLLFLGSTPLRAPMRIGAFSLSLGLAMLVWPGRYAHPAARLLPLLALTLIPGLFIPGQPSVLAAAAQATLYLATLSPLLWVSHRAMTLKSLRRVLLVLWAFNALSAAVGVLQVFFPGLFQSQLSSVVAERGIQFVGSLTIQLADGSRALRPMGLTDTPGGAASGGQYAILFGLGLLFTERRWYMRTLAVSGMILGLFVIYLTHVRVTFILAGLGVGVIATAFAVRGDVRRVSVLAVVSVVVAGVGTLWAFTVGGEDTVNRFATLTEAAAGDVYQQNRGYFLDDAFTVLPFKFPFGAGAGRWGMISYYFGDPKAEALWAEIQWQAWIYDGGLPLTFLYCGVIGVSLWVSWRIATARSSSVYLGVWAAVVLAYNVGAVAATFDGPIFATQAGLELWFVNACLYNAWRASSEGARPLPFASADPVGRPAAATPGPAAAVE